MVTQQFTLDENISNDTPVATITDSNDTELIQIFAEATDNSQYKLSIKINKDIVADSNSSEQWIDITDGEHITGAGTYNINFKQNKNEENIGNEAYCGISIENVNGFTYYLYNSESQENDIQQVLEKYPNQVLSSDVYQNLKNDTLNVGENVSSVDETNASDNNLDDSETADDGDAEQEDDVTENVEQQEDQEAVLETTTQKEASSTISDDPNINSGDGGNMVFLILIFIIVSCDLAINLVNLKSSKKKSTSDKETNSSSKGSNAQLKQISKKIEEMHPHITEDIVCINNKCKSIQKQQKDTAESVQTCIDMVSALQKRLDEHIETGMQPASTSSVNITKDSTTTEPVFNNVLPNNQVTADVYTTTQPINNPTTVQPQQAVALEPKPLSKLDKIYASSEPDLKYFIFDANKKSLIPKTFQSIEDCHYKGIYDNTDLYLVPSKDKVPVTYPGIDNYFEFDSSYRTLSKSGIIEPCVIVNSRNIKKGKFN